MIIPLLQSLLLHFVTFDYHLSLYCICNCVIIHIFSSNANGMRKAKKFSPVLNLKVWVGQWVVAAFTAVWSLIFGPGDGWWSTVSPEPNMDKSSLKYNKEMSHINGEHEYINIPLHTLLHLHTLQWENILPFILHLRHCLQWGTELAVPPGDRRP